MTKDDFESKMILKVKNVEGVYFLCSMGIDEKEWEKKQPIRELKFNMKLENIPLQTIDLGI